MKFQRKQDTGGTEEIIFVKAMDFVLFYISYQMSFAFMYCLF